MGVEKTTRLCVKSKTMPFSTHLYPLLLALLCAGILPQPALTAANLPELKAEGEGSAQEIFTVNTRVTGNYGVATVLLDPSSSPGLAYGQYYQSTVIQMQAIYNSGIDQFSKWQLDGQDIGDTNPKLLTVRHDMTLTAVFVPASGEGEGEGAGGGEGASDSFMAIAVVQGNTAPAAVSMQPTNSAGLPTGHFVPYTVIQVETFYESTTDTFLGWQLNGVQLTAENPKFFTVREDLEIIALFSPVSTEGEGEGGVLSYLLSPYVTGNSATASVVAVPSNSPGLPYGRFLPDTSVRIYAEFNDTVDAFTGWRLNGIDAGTENPRWITMTEDYTLLAIFEPAPPEGEGEGNPEGEGEGGEPVCHFTTRSSGNSAEVTFTLSPAHGEGLEDGYFFKGATVELAVGYDESKDAFAGWGLAKSGEKAVRKKTFLIDQDLQVTAYFQAIATEGEGEGTVQTGIHSADWHEGYDNQIDLTELLRVIQFFNSDGYHCAQEGDLSDEGFMPGPGPALCQPHDADYFDGGSDWVINLSELLRIIQFYNLKGYHACPDADPATEDGFCTGLPE